MMNETSKLTVAVEGEDHLSPVLRKIAEEADALKRKLDKFSKSFGSGSNKTFADQQAQAQERANRALQRGLGLSASTGKQTDDATQRQSRANRLFENDAIRSFRMRMRHNAAELKANERADRDRERAQDQTERRDQRAARTAESEAVRRFRFSMRMTQQRAAEARAGERDRQRAEAQADRDASRAQRQQEAGDRRKTRDRERMDRRDRADRERDRRETIGKGREALDHGRDAYRGLSRPAGAAAVIGTAATAAGVRRILGAESDVDAAEISTRAYGGLSKDAARDLRDKWAAPLSEALGMSTAKLLTSYTDALKLGIPNEGARAFSELATKTSEAWGVPFENVTDILGTVNSILTAKGDAFNFDKLKSTANTIQHLAAKQSTTPEKLMSFLQRGAGAADMLGMSQDAGLAFGSASTSLGNQAAESGRLFDYVASRLIEMPRLTRRKGEEGDQARDLVRQLGFSSADQMEAKRRADPDAFLPEFMDRFSKIRDPKKQDQAIRFFTGREWLGEFGRMVKGIETYKEAAKLAREAKGLDAIGDVWSLHKLKLAFVFKQFKSGWLNILGEFGKVISPLARQAGDFFLAWTGKLRDGGLKDRFRAMLDGLMDGLGVKDFPDLLKRVFGDPKDANGVSIEAWRAAARGFGQGIREVVDTITGAAKIFTGGSTDPEAIGRLTAKVLGFGLALMVVAPFVSILGAIGSGLLALAATATVAWRVMRAIGVVGDVAKGAAPGTGPAAKPGMLGRLGRLAMPAWIAQTLGMSKADQDAMTLRLGEWAKQKNGSASQGDTGEVDGLQEALRSLDPELANRLFPGGARLQRQSAGEDWRGLIHPAVAGDEISDARVWRVAGRDLADGFLARMRKANGSDRAGTFGGGSDAVDRLERAVSNAGRGAGGTVSTSAVAAALGVPSSSGGGGVPGTPGDPAKQFGSRFFTPPGMQVPGWYGGGSGVTAPMLKGQAQANAKTSFDFFRSKGLSTEAASGILASMKQESGFNPRARGDGGKAHGLFQHHPDRRAAIMRATGIDMSTASVEDQLKGAWWEMNHGDAGAQRALRILKTPGITARQAGGAFVQHFERPARDERASRGAMAEGFAREMGPGGTAPAAPVVPGFGVHPMDGLGRMSSPFGMRRHPITGALKMHNGLDLAAPAGTIVKAMKDGIASIDRSGDVSVKHDDGSSTTYRHVRAEVAAGARVAAGQMIARLRAHDPRSTGPHLHLEARDQAGQLYDPSGMIGASKALQSKATGGWQAGAGGNASALAGASQASRGERLLQNIPVPPQRPAGIDGGGSSGGRGQGSGVIVNQTINGAGKNPQELAQDVQRHITEAWNHRAHDLEPELT